MYNDYWDGEERIRDDAYYHEVADKEILYQQLMRRLAEEKKRRARKFKEPDRGQTSLDQFSIER